MPLIYVTSQNGELVRQDTDLGRYIIRKEEKGFHTFRTEEEAYTYMWEASHKEGYAYKEHAAYVLINGNVILLPVFNNTSTVSHNYYKMLRKNDDGTYTLYSHGKVAGYTHTHPGSTSMAVSDADRTFMRQWPNMGTFKTIANGGNIYQTWSNGSYRQIGIVKR